MTELAQSFLTAAEALNLSPQKLTEKLPLLVSGLSTPPEMDAEVKVSDLESQEDVEPVTFSKVVADEQPLSLDLPETETGTTTSDSGVNLEQVGSVSSSSLFERMEQQQESLQALTAAIGDLVGVLTDSHRAPAAPTLAAPGAPPLTKPEPQPKPKTPRQIRSEYCRQKVNRCVDAIMAYNDVLGRPHADKWSVSISALKRLSGVGQSVVYQVIDSRKEDIDWHHRKHQLDEHHNQKGKNAPKIESLIRLD